MDKDAYPGVPRELLRPPRRNKQAVIDALVAALESAKLAHDYDGIWPGNKIDAALALARKGGK